MFIVSTLKKYLYYTHRILHSIYNLSWHFRKYNDAISYNTSRCKGQQEKEKIVLGVKEFFFFFFFFSTQSDELNAL